MSVDIEVVKTALMGAGLVCSLVAGFWAVFVLAGKQFEKRLDERFELQEKARVEGRKLWNDRLTRLEEDYRQLERAYLKHLAELPREYVRREDHIRFETVITAKLDALYAQLQLQGERALAAAGSRRAEGGGV